MVCPRKALELVSMIYRMPCGCRLLSPSLLVIRNMLDAACGSVIFGCVPIHCGMFFLKHSNNANNDPYVMMIVIAGVPATMTLENLLVTSETSFFQGLCSLSLEPKASNQF